MRTSNLKAVDYRLRVWVSPVPHGMLANLSTEGRESEPIKLSGTLRRAFLKVKTL